MSLRRYNEYKETGEKIIASIPASWGFDRLKSVLESDSIIRPNV